MDNGTALTLTTGGFLDDFARGIDAGDATRKQYVRKAGSFVEYCRSAGVVSPRRVDVVAYRDALSASGKSPATVRTYLVAVRRLFVHLAAEGRYPNIADGVKAPKLSKVHKRDALTREQARSVVDGIDQTTLQGKRDFALINLLFRTGVRTIEAVRASVGDIRNMDGVPVLFVHGKGREEADDFVPLSPEALKPLRDYLSARGTAGPEAPLFASLSRRNRDSRLTTRTVRGIVKRDFRSVGLDLPSLTAHSCRHSAVTMALQAGATLQEVQAFARHSRIETTLIYSHNLDRAHNTAPGRIQF